MKTLRILVLCATCNLGAGLAAAARPHDPFILRAVLMNKPRMVLIALEAGLSVAYDASNCGLYQAWRGGVQDGNLTYNHQKGGNHGATYYPQGRIVFKQGPAAELSEMFPPDTRPNRISPPNEAAAAVWSVTRDGAAVPARVDYRGYDVDNAKETAVLRYSVHLPSGSPIQITEAPEFSGNPAALDLTRDFAVTGLAAGTRLALLLTGNPIRKSDGQLLAEEWTASGDGRIEKIAGKSYFIAETSGKTRVTGAWK